MARTRSWFLPETPDVLGMLRAQAAVTIEGMAALTDWAAGEASGSDRLRAAEHAADGHKRTLQAALRTAFVTPIGAEDIYVLSERLDAVLNGAKDAVRESEVLDMPPDDAVRSMSELIAGGVTHLASAFDRLAHRGADDDDQDPTAAADQAIRSQRELERVYRGAMSSLLAENDLRVVMGRREMYRRFSRISEVVIEVAERVWYSSVKEA
ncbi:MAG TPA: DUF47 family protein [Candidatus Saccharimonadia bacterium]|nr:DUF47 family protein [Candidatus Saccharimonadia bacterium]